MIASAPAAFAAAKSDSTCSSVSIRTAHGASSGSGMPFVSCVKLSTATLWPASSTTGTTAAASSESAMPVTTVSGKFARQ